MIEKQFKPVNPGVKFPEIEKEVLSFWKKNNSFQQSLEQTKDKKPYVFYDGPPFATGLPHYGHLLAGTIKDIIPRYWTMRKRHVSRRFGWDCHGLPVENEMEKEFNVSGKKDIEKIGKHIFNEACRSIVLRYTEQWEEIVNRMGRWVDFENQYRTMDPSFMESIWWVFNQVWKKDLIYKGFRVQPYCPRCATPLSNFEVNEGYKDAKSPSITVKFQKEDEPDVNFLVWTTTPWTLPSNVLLAAGPDVDYVKVKDDDSFFIMAKERLGAYYKDESEYEIIQEMKGSSLKGMRYKPVFPYFKNRCADYFQVVNADFVSTEDGTGIVHIAPAFGEDDFQAGKELELPIACPVDEEGRFTSEVPQWEGKNVFGADEEIIKELKKRGVLVHKTKIEHRYPFCYRCDSPLIYKAIDTWFMKIEPLKKNMLKNNENIHWVPPHLQKGRFGKGIESAPDWNISRNRYWGTPIPLWECDCGSTECVGSLEKLHELAGNGNKENGKKQHLRCVEDVANEVKKNSETVLEKFNIDKSWAERIQNNEINENDIHSHIIDRLELKCPKCGKTMKRTPEVLDCWFESGSMPYAQNHYPFEHKEEFEKGFPADFIAEGLDQTRGWFYTLTVLGSALFGSEAFKNVIVNGIILADDGKKLSKRLKNYAPPKEVLDKLGADALRIFLINSPAVKAEELRFSESGVREMSRAVLLPFWNSYSFFVTYTNIDNWRPESMEHIESSNELDRWIVSVLNNTAGMINENMKLYNLHKVVPLLVDFIDDLTNWYIRRSRRRFWKSEDDSDKMEAYGTLYYILVRFSRLMAPFLPFITESVYRNLTSCFGNSVPESVHLCSYPDIDSSLIDKELETKMGLVRQVVTMGRSLRSKFNLKIRQPLKAADIIIRNNAKRNLLKKMQDLIKEELNVKEVNFDSDEEKVVSISAKPDFRRLGKRFGKNMKEASRIITGFSREDIKRLEEGEATTVLDQKISFEDIVLQRQKHEGLEVETEGEVTVALDTKITDELLNECHAREFINRIQNIRKNKGFNVTDRISISCSCEDNLKNALENNKDYIMSETLALSMSWEKEFQDPEAEETEINSLPVTISVTK